MSITVGPYELISKKNSAEKVTICIIDDKEVLRRSYKGAKIVSSNTEYADNFEDAMDKLQTQIESFKADYDIKEPRNGPKD